MKKQNKMRVFYMNEYEKFFFKFPYIFSKTILSLNFFNWTHLFKKSVIQKTLFWEKRFVKFRRLCRLPSSCMKMKLSPAENDIYLLQINSLETTVTGVYIPWNHYFLEYMFALPQKPASPCMKKTDFTTGFSRGPVFPRRENMDSMKQQQ